MSFTIWLTGVPAVGKTTIGKILADNLRDNNEQHCVFLDADEVRKTYWPKLGLTPASRVLNFDGITSLASVCLRRNSNVVIACIAPFADDRNRCLKQLQMQGPAFLVYLHAPLLVLRDRDPKGLYRKQSEGIITGLTGVDGRYDIPKSDEVLASYDTNLAASPEMIVENIIHRVAETMYVGVVK